MKTLIIYDSVFGNTGKIAQNIFNAFPDDVNAKICHINYIETKDLFGIDLVIIGSPTRGFRPTESISRFIKNIPSGSLSNVKVAAFDTRLSLSELNSKFLRFIVKTGGYAASFIARILQSKGGNLIIPPEGFLVTGDKGPLKNGELERTKSWINNILNTCKN